jgi:hypothetical protein
MPVRGKRGANARARVIRPGSGLENQRSGKLSDLAACFIANHLRASQLPDRAWASFRGDGARVGKYRQHRVIVVVGAGATERLPTSSDAIKRVRNQIVTDHFVEEEVKRERDRLKKVFDQDPERFDTELAALSLTPWRDQKVRELFAEMYRQRYIPLLQYELIAHLFKHRFVDAVINFNFDELLDQSIADELNPDEYVRVVSEGEIADNDGDARVYLKPHGTVSVPSSLRYTRDQYWSTPPGISDVMTRLVVGQPVVVVTMGFALGSFDLNSLLDNVRPASELYCLDIKRPKPMPALTKLVPKFVAVERSHDHADLGASLVKVWGHIRRAMRAKLPTRSIDRHVLITRLFDHRRHTPSIHGPREHGDDKYFRDRTLVELCLSFAKGKGLINLSQLAGDRVGIYFGKHAKHHLDDEGVALTELCEHLKLVSTGYGNETMTFQVGAVADRSPSIMSEGAFKTARSALLDILLGPRLLSPAARTDLENNKKLFQKTMLELYRADEVEFRVDTSVVTRALFRKVVPLDNATAVHWRTRELLQANFDTLLVIAETGEWMLKEKALKTRPPCLKRVCVIVADRSKESSLRKRFGDSLLIGELDWWDHNRHMTIAVQDRAPIAGIYFARRMRSASVAPVWLNENDSKVLLELFVAYWIRSQQKRDREAAGPGDGRASWITSKQARDFGRFFDDIYRDEPSPAVTSSGADSIASS